MLTNPSFYEQNQNLLPLSLRLKNLTWAEAGQIEAVFVEGETNEAEADNVPVRMTLMT